ncbi:hypothetical protein C8034_v011959 [Colletotrichum sidae]|uniref:Caib baif family enzyme n=1 Tax=Colletotrichum sidae TaxID=1347389 RepID=A0A4R8TK80_9PEZI|nr:hypothetical protein C8034_v011959 [Colletotrichum sidae]
MSASEFEQTVASRPLCHIVTPVGCMGYGFDEDAVSRELASLTSSGTPTAIILDAGSTDSGPEKLALGTMTCPRSAYVKDLTKLLRLVHDFRVPLIFSSAGGDGADEHVRLMEEIVEEIAAQDGNDDYTFKTMSIFSSIDKQVVLDRIEAGHATGCGICVPPLTKPDVEDSSRIVAQIGPEPFMDAMVANPNFDVIIGGRAYDPAPFVAYSMFQLKQQYPNLGENQLQDRHGGLLHMGKIMECGGLCSTPKSHGAVATVYEDGVFDVKPIAPESKCAPLSVAAHSLYENTRPDILRGPGGALHLVGAKYEQLNDGRTVRVRGAEFRSSVAAGQPYQLKLEAARVLGYRSIVMGSVKDLLDILIDQLDSLLTLVKAYVKKQHPGISGHWDLDFHLYGKGQTTPLGPGEVFVIAEAVAPTQQLATAIVSTARIGLIHGHYPGQKATAGNFAFGIAGKLEIETGPCAQFSVYHLMDLAPGEERLSSKLLRSTISVIGRGQSSGERTEMPIREPPIPNEKATRKTPSLRDQGSPKRETLSDIARVLRSKNAGPYEITIDAIFDSEETYNSVKRSGLLTATRVAEALKISEQDIVWAGFFDPALAFKVTIPRFRGGKRAAAGSFMENDIHGSQQHLGLALLKLPDDFMA